MKLFGTITKALISRDMTDDDYILDDNDNIRYIKLPLMTFIYDGRDKEEKVLYINGTYWGPKKNWESMLDLSKKDTLYSIQFELRGTPSYNENSGTYSLFVNILDFELPRRSGSQQSTNQQEDTEEDIDMADIG